jgi:hypothetical protein
MNSIVENPLKIIPLDRRTWRCESGMNTYRISSIGDGRYHCSCPARVECRHVKQLKGLHQIQAEAVTPAPAPIERRQSDRRASTSLSSAQDKPLPQAIAKPRMSQEERIERLRTDLSKLLYGFKDDLQDYGRDAEIERLRLELSTILRLGFGADRTLVFINNKYNCTWYTKDGEVQPIKEKFLFGLIKSIEFKPRQGEGRPSHHLHCTIEADKRYVLHTGYDNHFSKGLLAAVARMSIEQLQQPVHIQPQVTGKTTLCNLHQHGVLIKSYYNDQSDWKAIAIQSTKNVLAAQH